MKAKKLFILSLAVMMLVSGCGRKGTSQSTPKETLKSFIDALLQGNKEEVMSCVTGEKLEVDALSVFVDYVITVQNFKKAVIDKYGASGWANFENEGGAKLSLNLVDQSDKLDSAKIEITGDKAACTVPGEANIMYLHRKDGLWYVDASGMLSTPNVDTQKFIDMWSAMTEIIKTKQQRIGQPGVTAESLDKEMGDDLMGILMGIRG